MQKAILLMIFLSLIFCGCAGNNEDNDESLNDYLKKFENANSFQYNTISEEKITMYNGTSTKGSINSYTNAFFVRKPYYRSVTAITQNTLINRTIFSKQTEEFEGETFELSRFVTSDIKTSDFSIDSKGNVAVNKEFEKTIKMSKEPYKNMPLPIKQMSEPFLIPVSLIEINYDTFQLDKGNKNKFEITYRGHFKPDTLVDYYANDGNSLFETYYPNHRGKVTRDALKNETIKGNYNALVEPLNALLFTGELTPVTFTVNTKEDTYDIIINMTNAKNGLNKVMYADTPNYSINVNKSVAEYKNIMLKD